MLWRRWTAEPLRCVGGPGLSKLLLIFLAIIIVAGASSAASILVPVPTFSPTFETTSDGIHVTAPDYANLSSPGDPSLPLQDIRIVIPPNADATSVSVKLIDNKIDSAAIKIPIAAAPPLAIGSTEPQFLDWGHNKQIDSGRNILTYSADQLYPASHTQLIGVDNLRKWKIVTIRYFPLRYNPVTGSIEQVNGGRIVISYDTKIQSNAVSSTLLADNLFADRVRDLTSNFDEAQTWYNPPTSFSKSSTAQSGSSPGYTIITTSNILSASQNLSAFVAHKASRGFTVEVATENDWGGGTGDEAAENIRSYLAANYISKQIQYVLLIGNPDPASGDVPMKMLWPRYYSVDSYREAPSDYYYADLTGNWDLNGDGFFGQQEGDFGAGGVDIFPEVIVGRIPCYGDVSNVDSILDKTINYESGAIKGDWLRNVLLSMKPSDGSTPAYQLGEAIKADAAIPAGMTATRVYENNYGLTPPPEFTPCTFDTALNAWHQRAGFHFWWTHGNATTASEVIDTSSCQYLDDDYPLFTFQCSCLNGTPERSDNLGYALLKQGAIATNSATRVSWYMPGQTKYTNTDTNAGIAYIYAIKLIRDHLPCGDAHYATLTEVPNNTWMNHCVFNVYGDPSVRYPSAPTISHTPLRDTDETAVPYLVQASVNTTTPIAADNPMLHWKTSGSADFTTQVMQPLGGTQYSSTIPAQNYGTTVYYYFEASDSAEETSVLPSDAPESLFSFQIKADIEPPHIDHTPLANTANKFGPYPVTAIITDDLDVKNAFVHYSINDGPVLSIPMEPGSDDTYTGNIPGPAAIDDTISYYITATDISLDSKTARLPETGSYSFSIGQKIYVGVYNSKNNPFYFQFGNTNSWEQVSNILNSDPEHRFQVSVITNLKGEQGSIGIEGQDVLILPDNAVPIDCMQTVSNWFQPGKIIIALDSAAAYVAYTGWMWPDAQGSNGYTIIPGMGYWTNASSPEDQEIWLADPITKNYAVGQIIDSLPGNAAFFTDKMPEDARLLTGSREYDIYCYAAYREVPDKGRIVILGPYSEPLQTQYALIREAAVPPAEPRQIKVISPDGGESYSTGSDISITFSASGGWEESDLVKIEYCTAPDSQWIQIPGAQSLSYTVGAFTWNTSYLPGSRDYRVRVSTLDDTVSDESDAPFSIIPNVSIAAAKSIPDGSLIRLSGKVVTCALDEHTYVEEPNRQAGIKITGAENLSISSIVNITGHMNTTNGERTLNADAIEEIGTGAQIRPFLLSNRTLGGTVFGLQSAVMEYKLVESNVELMYAVGLNNTGLLVRVTGRVVDTGSDWFYIDDGSGCDDGSGIIGVRVISPGTTPPAPGKYVILNAISSTYYDRGRLWRALILPGSGDLTLADGGQ